MERLPGQRGEGELEVPAQAVPAPLQSTLGLEVERPSSLNASSVLSLQRSAGNAAVTAMLQRDAEGAADDSVGQPAFRSPALLLRSQLRSRSSLGRATLQRAVTTSGGEWDTDKYPQAIDVDGQGSPVPAAQGVRGVDIDLRFKPNGLVDAELIGLTQTAQTIASGAPVIVPAAASRAIPAADAKPISTGAGETDESAHIDQSATNTNPIYAVESPTSKSLSDKSNPSFGENGWHFTKAGKIEHKDALLKDTPRLPGGQKNSRQIFETTALATKGTQAGTYYGSVRWGWRSDAAGKYKKLDLEKVSDGVPSSTFLKAAAIWNPGKSSTGADNVDLPIPDVKVTTAAVTLIMPVPMVDVALPVGTRLQIVNDSVGPMLNGTVKVVDGPHTGATGDVSAAEWSNIDDERA